MAYVDTEVDRFPHVAEVASLSAVPDWRRLYEQTLERAESAEARAEELKWAEVAARGALGSLRWQFKEARRKRLEAVEVAAGARRAAKRALFLEAEVARLSRLLEEVGVDPRLRGGEIRLRREVRRLQGALRRSVVARDVPRERVRCAPAALDAALRKALGRLRRQKRALNAVTQENARLRRTVGRLRCRTGKQELEIAKLRSTGAVLSKTLHGPRSGKRKRAGTGRPRGQVRGAPGHGRTQRPVLEERVEEHDPPEEARTCGGCGKPYAAVGAEQSALAGIEVKAHRRVIRRGRWRRTCGCPASPAEVSAPPVPRLFPDTPYGTSVWSRVLYERHACRRPARRVGAWFGDQGMPVAAGTLAAGAPRFVPLFEPLAEAILEHQTAAALRHADETGWRVQALRAEGRSARAWLWISVGNDAVYFHIDPSRSAAAARTLLGELRAGTVLVCDRYSAYKKLARLLGGLVILQYCWAHQRRDFIQCAAGQADLAGWCGAWLERIAAVYRLNAARLAHHVPGAESQGTAFDAAQHALGTALDDVFARAGRELAKLPEDAREAKALRALVNHREGLTVFVDHPRTPMDNNLGERLLRDAVIGRRLSFGSDSRIGAHLAALMYSVIGTLNLNGIDVPRWLDAWLAACAHNGGRPPDDLAPWLPWSMDDARRREPAAPG